MDNKPEELDPAAGFLARWSERKRQAGGPATALESDQRTPVEPAQEALPTDADMPPLESLTEDSDYIGFLSPRVSEELRRLALRKLFHGAEFNLRDGLDDYDEDYTSFAKLGNIVTAEMRRRLETEVQRHREQEASEVVDAGGPAERTGDDQTRQPSVPGDDGSEQVPAVASGDDRDTDEEGLAT